MLKNALVDFHADCESFVIRMEAASCIGLMMIRVVRKIVLFSLLSLILSCQCVFASTSSTSSSHKSATTHSTAKKSSTKSTASNKKTTSSKLVAHNSKTTASRKPAAHSKKTTTKLVAHNTKPKHSKTNSAAKKTTTLAANKKSPAKPSSSGKEHVVVADNTKNLKTSEHSVAKTKAKEPVKLASHSSSKHHMGLHASNLNKHKKQHLAYGKSIQIALADLPEESKYFADEIKHGVANLAGMVNKTIATMHYSHYQMGGSKFDPSHGVYVVDCSSYVDRLLNQVNPDAYFNLVHRTGTDRPTTEDYYNFFNNLAYQSSHYWRKVDNANNLQAGDILVFRSGWNGGGSGHVMVVMNKPVRHDDVLMVRVADSASSGHSQDTRPAHTSGIGIGTMLIKVNHTNQPAAYAWRVGAPWENVRFAMGRPLA